MAKTKIVVIQMKELIYTAIFAGLGILLIVLLIIMFLPDKSNKEKTGSTKQIYTPGVYTSQIKLGDTTLNLEVAVDADQVKSVALVNLEESVTTMYPLVKPSLESIEKELIAGTKLEDVPLSDKSKYTESLLSDGIRTALNKAVTNPGSLRLPQCPAGIAWHTQIAARRYRYRTNLWPVRQTRPFELLCKKTAKERI